MKNRRKFLRTSALSLATTPFISLQHYAFNTITGDAPIVIQPEECETYFVRENTPITFHISKTNDNISTVSLLTEELIPGSHIPMHKHLYADEYFFFITGTGSVTIDDTTFTIKPGTTAFIPKNTWHSVENTGTEKAIFAFGYTPSGFEDFFKDIGTPVGQPYKQKPKEEFDIAAKKYGMVFR